MADKTRTPTGSLAKLMATKGGGRSASRQSNQAPTKVPAIQPQEPNDFEADTLEVTSDNKPAYPTRPHDPAQEYAVKTDHSALVDAPNVTERDKITVRKLSDNDQIIVGQWSENDMLLVRKQSDNGQIEHGESKERSDKQLENGQTKTAKRSDNSQKMVRQNKSNQLSYNSLVGLQKTLVDYYYESIQANGGESTHEIRSYDLEMLTGSGARTVVDANYQLTQKGFIYRTAFKLGRSGWTKFDIEQTIKEQMYKLSKMRNQLENGQITVRKRPAEWSDESPSCINSSYNSEETDLKTPSTTTTKTKPGSRIEPDYTWVPLIDIPSDLSLIINDSHLRQLARHGFTALDTDAVQSSLDNLALAIQLGHKYKNPPGLFLAAMKRDGYVSPVEGFEFNRERTRRLMEDDKAKVEAAVQEEVTRLAYEKLDGTRPKAESLDITPF